MSSREPPDQIETDVRTLARLLPQVLHGLKRGAPDGIREAMAEGRLAPRHMPVLRHVTLDGPISVTLLAERLGVTLAAASLMVSELDASGFVERAPDPADRRRTLVSAAPAVGGLLESCFRSGDPFRHALTQLEPAERAVFLRGLGLLAAELAERRPPA